MKQRILFLVLCMTFVYCNISFSEAPIEESKAKFPIGYPWSSWGEITETPVGHQEKGFKLDSYVEQGIDWVKLGESPWVFNTFVGLRGTVSSERKDFWNNKVGPWLGFKFKDTLDFGENHWGEVALGVRWEYNRYFVNEAPQKNDNRIVLFLLWSFGGDWKKE